MLKISNSEFIGEFKISSGCIRITDPIFDKKTSYSHVIDDVKNGEWESFIKPDDTGQSVSELLAFNKNIPYKILKHGKWLEQSSEIIGQSGLCGLFDEDLYPTINTGDIKDKSSFYSHCFEATESAYAAIIPFGSVSRTLDGGPFSCFTLENDGGDIVGIKIIIKEELIDDYINDEDDYDRYHNDDNSYYYSDYDDEY